MKDAILAKLEELSIDCKVCEHEPVLDYETAKIVDERFGLTGVESKSLFIKTKSGKYYVFLTIAGERLDSKKMKNLLGEKVGVVSGEELTEVTGCQPGCAAPFGYAKEIGIIVSPVIFEYEKFIFSPGIPEMTVEAKTEDLKKILDTYENEIIWMEAEEEE